MKKERQQKQKADATAQHIAGISLILDKEKITALKGQSLKDQLKVFKLAAVIGHPHIYMCHHIKPDSVDTSRVFKSYFPNVHQIRKACLVHCTLEGCKHL